MTAETDAAGGGLATVYLHGQPGSPAELDLFGLSPATRDWFAPDRAALPGVADFDVHLDLLAQLVLAHAAGRRVRLIGFSLGGFVALRLAERLGPALAALELVSVAAPPVEGAFPTGMAGKPVFDLARNQPRLFAALCHVQGLAARYAPLVLARRLFAGAGGADAQLAEDAAFLRAVAGMAAGSLRRGAATYRLEVGAYAHSRAGDAPGIAPTVQLWHGDADNWAPLALAQRLAVDLERPERLRIIPGAGHYAALAEFLIQQRAG